MTADGRPPAAGRFDAHLWAHAEVHGLDLLRSEDFQHDRMHGTVRAVDPFRAW
jgi:predicted nucleic acid-binding protein